MLKFYINLFLSLYFLIGCGDLDPEIQDKRTVVLKMDFQKRSSSRNSANISSSELSQYNTHLIVAVPSSEQLNSNYLSYYYSSFYADLMSPQDRRVSMEIPMNTDVKIFAFLFRGNYSLNDMYLYREVGAYGQSGSFRINNQTNNISLGITLQSAGSSSSSGTNTFSIEEVTPIGSSNDPTPNYTFASTIAGTITFGGSCSSSTTSAIVGNNTITLNTLSNGNFSNCTIKVTDSSGNESNTLTITTFTINALTDIDGNTYNTVLIGTQNWMAENLKVTKYRDGSNITFHINTGSGPAWSSLNSGAFKFYNTISNIDTYGLLYNWYAVDDSRGICPEGWHVPSRVEFETLSSYLGGDSVAGAKLKEAGTAHWSSTGGTNESGFTALPAGSILYSSGGYQYLGNKSYFWSSESSGTNMRILDVTSNAFNSVTYVKTMGFSIRCLED